MRRHAELDRWLGVIAVPVPELPPLVRAPRPEAEQAPPSEPRPPVAVPEGLPSAPSGAGKLDGVTALPCSISTDHGELEDIALRRARNEEQLEELARRMAGCLRCPLHEARTQLVFGQGDAAAELVFVGEGPGYHEDQQGLAFVGPSGELLTRMIAAMGLEREEVFICNVVKCRPPRNRAPTPDEMHTCFPFLREQLEIIRPRAICALGKTAAVGLGMIAPEASLAQHRGRVREWAGTPVVITYHPAYLLRRPEEKRKAWQDLQLLFPFIERRRTPHRERVQSDVSFPNPVADDVSPTP